MSTIYILWLRGLKHYFRSRAQIVASLGQPLLYLLVLGFGLGPVFQKAGQGNYLQFMAPGVIAMTVLFSSIFSGLSLIWCGFPWRRLFIARIVRPSLRRADGAADSADRSRSFHWLPRRRSHGTQARHL